MASKIIGVASDHAGFPLKQFVKQYLEEKGLEYKDYGTYTEESCNYAEFGHKLAEGIENDAGECKQQILSKARRNKPVEKKHCRQKEKQKYCRAENQMHQSFFIPS